jgi:hypothetical protein
MLSNPKATLPTVAGSSESSEPLPIDESPTEELAPPRTFRRLPTTPGASMRLSACWLRVLACGGLCITLPLMVVLSEGAWRNDTRSQHPHR